MSRELNALLSELREDHRNMSTLLDLVEAQLLRVDNGENPDLELMHDIMMYMTTYSDAIHHPKEDRVYAELQRSRAELAVGLEGVETDHEAIAELGHALRADIEGMISGAALRREKLVRDTVDYVRRLRKHMKWEEDDLFKRADKLASEQPMMIDIGPLAVDDPVFGATNETVFANLLRHLQLAASA